MFKVSQWVLVSRSKVLADLLDTRWPQEFLIKLHHQVPETISTVNKNLDVSLVVIDLASVDLQLAYQLQKSCVSFGKVRVVFIHFPKQIDARFLINPAVTAGVFFNDVSLESIGEGLSLILSGESCIPDELLNKDDTFTSEEVDSLTIREREVLQVLLTGSTNINIATQLYVSESTIKTHLYRAFRKIGVSSRGQAIAWAQTHLHEIHR